jgi:hypothetical protein
MTSCKLEPEQIAELVRLREVECWRWGALAVRFGIDPKTARRYCDPRFNFESNGVHENLGQREAKEEHRLRQLGDLRFKQRVLQIRRAGASEAKHFRFGVVTGDMRRRSARRAG